MGRFELRKAKNGRFYFKLVAANGQTVAMSQMYTTKQKAEQGVDAVWRAAQAAGNVARDHTEE